MPWGNVLPDSPTTRYVPGGNSTVKRPSAPERVSLTIVEPCQTVIRASYGRSGHGLSARSTGHVGPTVAVPAMPVSPDAGGVAVAAIAAGVPVALAAGDVALAAAIAVAGEADAAPVAVTAGVRALGVAVRPEPDPHATAATATTLTITKTTAAPRIL